MSKKQQIKKYTSLVLTAVMVLGMAAPAKPAYGANYGDASAIYFNTGEGPGLSYADAEYGNGAGGGSNALISQGGGVYRASGQAGYALTASSNFAGIGTTAADLGSGQRPKLPAFTTVSWPGYTFLGWYDKDGRKLNHLPYAFPYIDSVTYDPGGKNTYTAKWGGSSSEQFPFKVEHHRTLGNGTALEFFHMTVPQDSWITPVTVNTPISATYKRDIPGYTIASSSITGNQKLTFGNGGVIPGAVAQLDLSTHKVTGTMPNNNLTVKYNYQPNTAQRFPVKVKYIETANNTSIRTEEVVASYGAESVIANIAPPVIAPYEFTGAVLETGNLQDLEGSGVYSLTTAGGSFSAATGVLSGKMPNQAITIIYQYALPAGFATNITAKFLNGSGEPIASDQVVGVPWPLPAGNNGEYVIPVPATGEDYTLPSYSYSGQISIVGGSAGYTAPTADVPGSVRIHADGIAGGSIIFTYPENVNSENYATVTYVSGPHGSISGDTNPKQKPKVKPNGLPYTIGELTAGITPAAENAYYTFTGWYKKGPNGPEGSALSQVDLTNVTESFNLYAKFEETPSLWADIRFQAGPHGQISSVPLQHVKTHTAAQPKHWSDLNVPSVTSVDSHYQFAGWYDELGNEAVTSGNPDPEIMASQTYTAKFIPTVSDGGQMLIPSALGSIVTASGEGRIEVSGPSVYRQYVLTDRAGDTATVLKVINGDHAGGVVFENLNPCTYYWVYEVKRDIGPIVENSTILSGIAAADRSLPQKVGVPTLNGNADTSVAQRLRIAPKAANTEYALIDDTGAEVKPFTINPVFDGLEAGLYRVAARKQGSSVLSTSAEVMALSSVVIILAANDGGGSGAVTDYHLTVDIAPGNSISLTGYGITGVQRGSAAVTISNSFDMMLKEGDKVSLKAPASNDAGAHFKRFRVLLGDVTVATSVSAATGQFFMPEGEVKIRAEYDNPPVQPPNPPVVPPVGGFGYFKADYTSNSSKFALELGAAGTLGLTPLEEDLRNADDEVAQYINGYDVDYIIKLNQRSATTAESGLLASAMLSTPSNAYREAWALDLSLARAVEGQSTALVPDDGSVVNVNNTPEVTVYADMGLIPWNQVDYQLWEIENGMASDITSTVTPDPNSITGGTVAVNTKVGNVIILTYSKAYQVHLTDAMQGPVYDFKARAGETFEEASLPVSALQAWLLAPDYTEGTGRKHVFVGYSTQSTQVDLLHPTFYAYNLTAPINSNRNLYVIYDTRAWDQAKKDLEECLEEANDLMNSTETSQEDQDRLADKINEIEELLDAVPGPNQNELEQAYDELNDLMEEIRAGNAITPPVLYVLTVENGSGSGSYEEGAAVTITANPAPSGKVFDKWITTGGGALANANSATTTYTMPAGAASVKATYKNSSGGNGGGGGGGGGGSSSGGSGGGNSSGKGPGGAGNFNNYPTYWDQIDGNWNNFAPQTHGWSFELTGGTRLKGRWANIRYTNGNTTKVYTYHFDADGVMDSNWYQDPETKWYRLSTVHDGWFGHLITGWHQEQDGNWYYLNPFTGSMVTGWQQIDGQWYYFAERNENRIWGSMYAGATTPDGYQVEADGRWLQESP